MSFFSGRGKETAGEEWKAFLGLTPVLRALAASPEDISGEHMAVIERLVILLYNRTSSLTSVSEARQELPALKKVENLRQHSSNQSDTCLSCQEGSVSTWIYLAADSSDHVLLSWDGSVKAVSGFFIEQLSNKWKLHAMNSSTSCGRKMVCRLGCCKCIKANLVCAGLCNCQATATGTAL